MSLLGRGNDGAGTTESINGNAVNLKVNSSLNSCCGNTEEFKTGQKCVVPALHLWLMGPPLVCTDALPQIWGKPPLSSSVLKLGTLNIHCDMCQSHFANDFGIDLVLKLGVLILNKMSSPKAKLLCGFTWVTFLE